MNLIILDLETTGLDSSRHDITEIGAVKVSTKERFEMKVHPLRLADADPAALAINGFSLKDWTDEAFLPRNALRALSEFVGPNPVMMAYNASFDRMFLAAAYRECRLPYPFHYRHLDLMSIVWSKGGWDGTPSLANACQFYNIPPEPDVHRALAGAQKAYEVYQKLI